MLSLATAAAFVVDYASSQGKIAQLGKTKIFKTLYLADWDKFEATNETLFDVSWNRIQMGPALGPRVWQEIIETLREKYGIASGWQRAGSYDQFLFSTTGRVAVHISARDAEYLKRALDAVLDLTARAAALLTYRTEPMQWLVAQELALGAGVQFRDFRIRDEERLKFKKLAERYQGGSIGVGEIAKEIGTPWTANDVALFLDELGASRDISRIGLPAMERARSVKALRDFQTHGDSAASSKWVEESVVASQRIEGIHVPEDAFVEDPTAGW